MLGPFATPSRLTPIQQMSLAVLSTTSTTTTTTTHDRGDRYGPMEWAQQVPALTGWGKGENVTSARWQVTLCDPIWHVSSRMGSEDSCKLLHSESFNRVDYLLTSPITSWIDQRGWHIVLQG